MRRAFLMSLGVKQKCIKNLFNSLPVLFLFYIHIFFYWPSDYAQRMSNNCEWYFMYQVQVFVLTTPHNWTAFCLMVLEYYLKPVCTLQIMSFSIPTHTVRDNMHCNRSTTKLRAYWSCSRLVKFLWTRITRNRMCMSVMWWCTAKCNFLSLHYMCINIKTLCFFYI